MPTKRIVLLSNRSILVAGIRRLLEKVDGLELAVVPGDDPEANKRIRQLAPQAILLDCEKGLPDQALVTQMLAEHPKARVIVLGVSRQDAGALIGYAAQQAGGTDSFTQWQRYLGIGGGVVILALAVRTAAKVRAPLVCKMPVLAKMAHNPKPANPLELMVAGLAFATGCMTCFGAALVVSMVVFVGLSGSVAFGALLLFLFSLGVGIPLVIAATAMAKVLPLLFRMEKVIPWMGLAASLLMAGFALLLITGQYMVLTEWVYRLLPAPVAR